MRRSATFCSALLASLLCFGCQDDQNNSDSNTDTSTDSIIDTATDDHHLTDSKGKIYDDLAGTMVSFKSVREDFYDFPFPADHRRNILGNVDLTDFPYVTSLSDGYVDLIGNRLDGFSTNAPAYFHFASPLAESSLPTPMQTLEPTSTIRLINIDKNSDNYGQQIPVALKLLTSEESDYYPTNTLAVMPYPGFPLDPKTTYAIIILRDLGDNDGNDLGSPALLQAILNGAQPPTLAQQDIALAFKPLATYLKETVGPKVEDIAAATVFTTQDPRKELLAIHEFINNRPAPVIQGYKYIGKRSNSDASYYVVDAYYFAPNYQHGKKPYFQDGGDFRFNDDGTPIVAVENEYMKMRFSIPLDSSQMPEKGWPLVMIAHGTGGDYSNYEWGGSLTRSTLLTNHGMAAVGISQPLHYERSLSNVTADDDINALYNELDEEYQKMYAKIGANYSSMLDLLCFNMLNPYSGRYSFQQSAADTFQLVKMLKDNPPVIPADVAPDGKEVKFDTSDLLFHGHSHGGISGAIALGVEHSVKASVHSGAGGFLSGTATYRLAAAGSVSEYISTILSALLYFKNGDSLNYFHPLLMVVQTAADATDPVNYAPYYFKKSKAGEAHNILFTIGLHDADTPYQVNDFLTAAADIPVVGPERWESVTRQLKKLTPQAGTVSQNCKAADGTMVTCGIRQYGNEDDPNGCEGYSSYELQDYCGHFVIFDKEDAANMYVEFLESYLKTGKPYINPEWGQE